MRRHPLESRDALIARLAEDPRGEVWLIWLPDYQHMVLPESWGPAQAVVDEQRSRRLEASHRSATRRLYGLSLVALVVGLISFLILWQAAPVGMGIGERWAHVMQGMLCSSLLGLGLLIYLIAALVPWYDARKAWVEWRNGGACRRERLLPVLQFETWLEMQTAPVTRLIAGMVMLVGLAQWLGNDSIRAAGLVKPAYAAGEWWRLLTASFLHGNVVHFLMNLSALLYLGKRLEVFARWPHLLLVFVFASVVGGLMSAHWLPSTSVGASGGLMGWLGFLLAFESLHARLVPRTARRRLLAGVVLTVLIGLCGYRFIDNAAHAGGLLAGLLYGLVVFPRSSSVERPGILGIDRFAGGLAALVLLGSAAWAVVRILAWA